MDFITSDVFGGPILCSRAFVLPLLACSRPVGTSCSLGIGIGGSLCDSGARMICNWNLQVDDGLKDISASVGVLVHGI